MRSIIRNSVIIITLLLLVGVSVTGLAEETKKTEDIQPPAGEKWYEEGDEELYKFDIHPVTPGTGITGGILIYYGHLIYPPYKIESIQLNDNNKNGYKYRLTVNGLPIFPPPLGIESKLKISKSKNQKKYSKEEISEFNKREELRKEIAEGVKCKWNEFVQSVEINSDTGKKTIVKKMEKYLGSLSFLSSYRVVSFKQVRYCAPELKIDFFSGCQTIIFDTEQFLPVNEQESLKKKRETQYKEKWQDFINTWEKRLSYNKLHLSYSGYYKTMYLNELNDICKIINSKIKIELRIQELNTLTYNLKMSKLLFYNLDCKNVRNILENNK